MDRYHPCCQLSQPWQLRVVAILWRNIARAFSDLIFCALTRVSLELFKSCSTCNVTVRYISHLSICMCVIYLICNAHHCSLYKIILVPVSPSTYGHTRVVHKTLLAEMSPSDTEIFENFLKTRPRCSNPRNPVFR